MSRRTLAGRIQVRVAVTVAAMACALAILTLVVAQNLLTSQLDAELEAVPQRVRVEGSFRGAGVPRGTIIATQDRGRYAASIVGHGSMSRVEDDIEAIFGARLGHQSLDLPRLGRYRVLAKEVGDGERIIIGMPLKSVEETMLWLSLSALGISVVAVAATVVVTQTLIARATKPLGALTATAAQVSDQRLDRGVVEVPRVAVDKLPEEHEVAQVGTAFNRMLSHVEDALIARERSEAKLRRFVADASHELRNPLAAIRGYSELAERNAERLDEDTAFALGRISAESQRMRTLVENLLVLARLDAHQQASAQPVDAVEVVLNAVSDARAATGTHRWLVELPDEPVFVSAGPDQLQQVLVNLLANARTHTPEGTTVCAAVAPDGLITVTDDGPGIPEDLLPDVFERFTRADDARRYRPEHSTGLGLAIVKAQVESFGGTVSVESRPGHTRFAVRLPLASGENQPSF